jgi:GLPGLI family protein
MWLTYFVCLLSDQAPNYRAVYRLGYCPDSMNLSRKENERFILCIKQNQESFYASENYLKKDSVGALIEQGVLTENDIMADSRNRFRVFFPYFIHKKYDAHTFKAHELIALTTFTYAVQPNLSWTFTAQKDTISGYACLKAVTSYAGRHYEAWFTPDIPVADGPYLFSGLPGLIIKLNDTRNHYVFTLESFGVYTGKIIEKPTVRGARPIVSSRVKVFSFREDYRKNPFDYVNRETGGMLEEGTVQEYGSSKTIPIRAAIVDHSWNNNPLELK